VSPDTDSRLKSDHLVQTKSDPLGRANSDLRTDVNSEFVPGFAVLEEKDRFAYYLVTKKFYYQKPTYSSLKRSLELAIEHMKKSKVTCLSMPRIGCGLDKLKWERVEKMIVELFENTGIKVTVYVL
jgi:hypothetical protein